MIKFFVPGIPAPQGSKRAFVINGRAVMTEANKKTKSWRDTIAAFAHDFYKGAILTTTLKAEIFFYFPRPKKHFRANGALKDDQPFYKSSKPDTDKLIRACGDALTGLIWRDDSQIACWEVSKVYCDREQKPGMWIDVSEIE